jgi:DNA-binding transcriptional regulator of glucitol operon
MREGTVGTLVLLTFVGMVGLYIGAWMAYQKYQQYAATFQNSGGGVSGLLALASPAK